jgi:hypothetical protein
VNDGRLAYFDSTDSGSLAQIRPPDMPMFIEDETIKLGTLVQRSGAQAD